MTESLSSWVALAVLLLACGAGVLLWRARTRRAMQRRAAALQQAQRAAAAEAQRRAHDDAQARDQAAAAARAKADAEAAAHAQAAQAEKAARAAQAAQAEEQAQAAQAAQAAAAAAATATAQAAAEAAALSAAHAVEPPAAAASDGAYGAAPPLVLVADDSKVVRVKTSRLLVQHGYRVALAEDGAQAAALLDAELPLVLVTDVEMPGLDGFALTRHVRQHPRAARLPIIMITSADERLKAAAADAGVTLVLGKPYDDDALLACIRQAQATAPLPS